MYRLSVESVSPGMVVYEDIYTADKKIILAADTLLTPEKIQLLMKHHITSVPLAEPLEVGLSRYQHLQNHPRFQKFVEVYNQSLTSFSKMIKNIESGLEINIDKFLSLRDDVFATVLTGEQLIDYLYNLLANENQITYTHCFNCGLLCYVFAKWCELPEEDLDTITLCGFLFDIGKIKLDEELLWKQGQLSPEELIQMQHHIHLGYELIRTKNLPPHVVSVMIMHHERCDGSGYPAGIKAERIDPYALVAGLVDTYEAMTHPRAHRVAKTPFQAIAGFEQQGFHKFGEANTQKILSRIANSYADRRVCLSNSAIARIAQVHEYALSRPTVYCNKQYIDLRQHPELEIARMD